MLSKLGFEQIFLDFDKDSGIGAGENWERRLYEELGRCHAVILVLTPNWLASTWCRIELAQARALGKVILPVICAPLGERYVLPEVQAIDLIGWDAGGVERLAQRLNAITSELARGFRLPPGRSPYPGIHAFEADDAAIYFGRDEETRAVVERLDARRTQGGARLLLIIGASGSGKSSLMCAGVLPQIARRRPRIRARPPLPARRSRFAGSRSGACRSSETVAIPGDRSTSTREPAGLLLLSARLALGGWATADARALIAS